MNTQKIKFNVGDTTKEIETVGVYPYLINPQAGKVVLRITANEADASYNDLYALKNNTSGIIEYFERTVNGEIVGEWELKNTYMDYNSGEIHIDYQNGQYTAEVTRVDGLAKDLAQQRADIDYIAIMADIPLV